MLKLPIGVDISNLIDDLRVFSWEASDILLHYSKLIKNTNYAQEIIKSEYGLDPVTLADLEVNDLMIKKINKHYKGVEWNILSEENVKTEADNFVSNSDWIWVLDPLDGTKDFIQGTENYAMHLALNYEKRPYIGLVLIPEKGELWITDSEYSWCERKDGSIRKASSHCQKPLRDMTIVTSKNHRNLYLKNLINKVGFRKVNVMGSIGCKIASIVRGDSDLYICLSLPGKSSPKDWDFSAPEAILKAAGGAITNLNNEELSYGKSKFQQGGIIIASNNRTNHRMICLEIKEVLKKYDLYPFES